MIRRATERDIPKIGKLLADISALHHDGRPDLFKVGRKYSDEELSLIMKDDGRPVLVSVDERDETLGYCFCVYKRCVADSIMTDVKTLYIDDLCVDEKMRGRGIGKELYEAARRLAKDTDCYNLTLNVWSCNPSAIEFYEKCGLQPQKIGMEEIL